MDIDKKLELLKRIEKVDAPPFLLTRILARVESPESMPAPASWRLAFIALFITVISFNITLFFKSSDNTNSRDIEEVVYSMELSTSNDLYYE